MARYQAKSRRDGSGAWFVLDDATGNNVGIFELDDDTMRPAATNPTPGDVPVKRTRHPKADAEQLAQKLNDSIDPVKIAAKAVADRFDAVRSTREAMLERALAPSHAEAEFKAYAEKYGLVSAMERYAEDVAKDTYERRDLRGIQQRMLELKKVAHLPADGTIERDSNTRGPDEDLVALIGKGDRAADAKISAELQLTIDSWTRSLLERYGGSDADPRFNSTSVMSNVFSIQRWLATKNLRVFAIRLLEAKSDAQIAATDEEILRRRERVTTSYGIDRGW